MRASLVLMPLLTACAAHHPPEGEGHHHGHQMPHRFENAESWAKTFDDPARDAWQRPAEVLSLLALHPGQTVADLWAGTGYFLPYLSPAVGRDGKVLALDIEADMVRYMRERATKEQLDNVEARQVTTDDPGLEPESVDRILIVDTWHHIENRSAYATKLASALRPGGGVFIVDFTLETDKGPPKEHRLSPEKVIAELEAGGLVGRVVEEALPDQYVVMGLRR